MAIVESLSFKDWSGRYRTINLVSPEYASLPQRFHVTAITGRNGSYKSTFLKELVSALVLQDDAQKIQFLNHSDDQAHVVCMSGAVADRYPSKELPGGGNSEFDLPNYVYLGQRVGPNLLSKKRPLETMLTFALDEARSHRTSWDFFDLAHRLAGIRPIVEYQLTPKHRGQIGEKLDVLGAVLASANGSSKSKNRPYPRISSATAKWLLEEFDYDDFNALELILKRKKSIRLQIGSMKSSIEYNVENSPIRLGILTDLFSLSEVNVISRSTGQTFSAYDLSSGEYHIFSSVLGLGFGMRDASVVLIDEPENSLHPQWQQEFMNAIFKIGDDALISGHIVICTHSPLIVGAMPEGATVVDLGIDGPTTESAKFGASSDDILLSQFGIASSRNRVVIETVQRAVSLIERGDSANPEFELLRKDLVSIRAALKSDDPLSDVIDALLEEEEL